MFFRHAPTAHEEKNRTRLFLEVPSLEKWDMQSLFHADSRNLQELPGLPLHRTPNYNRYGKAEPDDEPFTNLSMEAVFMNCHIA